LTVAHQGASDSQLQILHSHLLRSNCPVTNQPDWGTLEIQIDSQPIDQAGLLEYILSFRQHNGFHEQCVEQIFSDLTQVFAPKTLMVRAWYTRRGGIDINPCRVSDISLLPPPSRLNRQ
jgi:7-cyano-7-deazaguanine reductase